MHIIIFLVIGFMLVYIFMQNRHKTTPVSENSYSKDKKLSNKETKQDLFKRDLVYISKGKLFYRSAENEINQIHSEYIQSVIDKAERIKHRHGWKENTSFQTMYSGGTKKFTSDQINIQVISALFNLKNRLIYFLTDENMGGLFEYDLEEKKEKRLLHKQNLFLHDLKLNPANNEILCSQHSTSGVANIALLSDEGSEFFELTGGDTIDASPAWIPGEEKKILFQSSGIARDRDGYQIACGPNSIQMLDLESNSLTPILDNPGYDFIQPLVCPNGNLHFIRRPYEDSRYSSGQLLTDTVFFPFRLLRAVFHYLNFFSMMYTRKPLTSASGPMVQADLKQIMLKGKKIDAEKALRKESSVKGVPSLVPKSWQLVCRNKDGQEKILATNVACYDITADGNVIYSNGCGVFLLDNNHPHLLFKDRLIENVIAK